MTVKALTHGKCLKYLMCAWANGFCAHMAVSG